MIRVKDIATLSDDLIRESLRRSRRRGRYRKHPRPCRTRDELVAYLKEKGFRTVHSLDVGRVEGDPTRDDYIKEFGSWAEARDTAFGKADKLEVDFQYTLKAFVEFGLWNRSAYLEARKKRPDILPSLHQINRRWGRFGNLVACARRLSASESIISYLKLRRKSGVVPTIDECRAAGLDISKLMGIFGGKRELDDYVARMEGMYEN
jgi:hypothetical protein